MSTVTAIKEPGTSIVAQVEATPALVLIDKEKFSQFYEAMRDECTAHKPDLTTEKGRKAIASLAYKVARTKTAIDDAGKALNEEARARINAVDEARREIRKQLDGLRDEVRAPLTEWEQAEEVREQNARKFMTSIREMRVEFEDTAETVAAKIDALKALTVDPKVHLHGTEVAQSALASAIETLTEAHTRLVREEADRAELGRLRAEAEERERREAEARAAEEEQRRAEAAKKAEADRLAAIQREAEERAKKQAEEEAQAERERIAREHEQALAAERQRAEEAERAAKAERDRIAKEAADRQAEADRLAAEQAARDADRAHRGRVMGAAKEAIMELGVDEAAAKAIVLAIAAGNIPAISIKF